MNTGTSFEKSSAYQGRGWRPRTLAFESEIAVDHVWSAMRVDSEYRRLKSVLLFCPGSELSRVRDPNRIQHLDRIQPKKIAAEFKNLAQVFKRLGVEVQFMDRAAFPGSFSFYNLMYARDLFFNTRAGAVIARMGSEVRAGEEKYAAHALASRAVPIARTISGRGLFEGADALWLDFKTVLCGIGHRTNAEGYKQLRQTLELQGVRCLSTRLPSGIQHLLGILQIVAPDLALVRGQKMSAALKKFLRTRGMRLIEIDDTDEVTRRQGMNVVTVAPKTVVMAAGCPELKLQYRRAGIKIAAEVEIPELLKGAGGIACATGILAREVGR